MAAICDLTGLPGLLLPWYGEHRRDLPWRADRQPYHVWLSEIMLQQTRVEAVKGYYIRFLTALPDIPALARCDDEVLHKLWEGLGYYSRVRNLKKAAQVVMERYGACPEMGEDTDGDGVERPYRPPPHCLKTLPAPARHERWRNRSARLPSNDLPDPAYRGFEITSIIIRYFSSKINHLL